jgi:hypothetical protein
MPTAVTPKSGQSPHRPTGACNTNPIIATHPAGYGPGLSGGVCGCFPDNRLFACVFSFSYVTIGVLES